MLMINASLANDGSQFDLLDVPGFDFLSPSLDKAMQSLSPRAKSNADNDDGNNNNNKVEPICTIAGLAARIFICCQVFLSTSYRVAIEPRILIIKE